MSMMRRAAATRAGLAALGILCPWLVLPAAAQPAPAPIDVELFALKEIDRSKGCSVGLWQADRDPDRNEYAYAFIEPLYGRNNARLTARIRIAGQDILLRRVATGGKNNGYNLFEHQLYRMPGEDEYVVLDLKLGELEGEAVAVESGTMSIIMKGRPVFRMSVKGGAGCTTEPVPLPAAPRVAAPAAPATPAPAQARQATAPPVAAPAAPPTNAAPTNAPPTNAPSSPAAPPVAAAGDHVGPFVRRVINKQLVARELKQSARRRFGCEDRLMDGEVIGFDLSEESAIWEIPCQSFAFQASSVFALVYTPAPGKEHKFLTFEGPRGRKRTNEPSILLNATWDVRARTVQGVSLGRASGDCGVLERYRVTAEGGFRLVEYREKVECDGKEMDPEQFPLVFRAR